MKLKDIINKAYMAPIEYKGTWHILPDHYYVDDGKRSSVRYDKSIYRDNPYIVGYKKHNYYDDYDDIVIGDGGNHYGFTIGENGNAYYH